MRYERRLNNSRNNNNNIIIITMPNMFEKTEAWLSGAGPKKSSNFTVGIVIII